MCRAHVAEALAVALRAFRIVGGLRFCLEKKLPKNLVDHDIFIPRNVQKTNSSQHRFQELEDHLCVRGALARQAEQQHVHVCELCNGLRCPFEAYHEKPWSRSLPLSLGGRCLPREQHPVSRCQGIRRQQVLGLHPAASWLRRRPRQLCSILKPHG